MLKIILANDDALVTENLKMLLTLDNDYHIIGEAANGSQVLLLMDQGLIPDIVVHDANMPEMDGPTLLKSLKQGNENVSTVTLSEINNPKVIEQCFTAGTSAYVLKSAPPEEIVFAVAQVAQGKRYLSSQLAIELLEETIRRANYQAPLSDLNIAFSSREMEVLNLIAEGLTNTEMSDRLFLSKRTIEGHRQSLIEKTGCRNTAAMIKFAVLNGIIQ